MYKMIGVDNQVYGPVDADQVRRWIQERRLSPQSQLQKEGETDWRPLSTFPEFADLLVVAPPPPQGQATATWNAPPNPGTNGMAIAGFVTSLLSFCCGPLGFVALILSGIALSQISKNPGQKGKGLAIAAIVISLVCIILAVLVFILRPFDKFLQDFGR